MGIESNESVAEFLKSAQMAIELNESCYEVKE